MDQTMVERVACTISGAPFPSAASMRKARAAIEAMRDATEPMKSAALDQYAFDALGHWTAVPARVYEAMIDAALAEEPTP